MSANVDILTLISQKQKKENAKKMVLEDVNQELIVSLLALPLYGKVANDEEILSVIINAGMSGLSEMRRQIKDRFDSQVKAKELKKSKDGFYRNKEGFIVLRPL